MKCPHCQSSQFSLTSGRSCPTCDFSGEPYLLERLSNLQFLLTELETWSRLPTVLRDWLRERYGRSQREVEVDLGLRPPPPTVSEARVLQQQHAELNALMNKLATWVHLGWISQSLKERLKVETAVSMQAIREQLIDAPPVPSLSPEKQLLQKIDIQRFLLNTIERLFEDAEITAVSYQAAISHLNEKITELEIEAGILQPPVIKETTTETPPESNEPEPEQPTRPKREPWTWDRLWDSLLSERTLQAILFLGAFLLFAAGVSWVAWNWGTFPPIIQVAFLGSLTAVFYGLGWYVRKRQSLRGSGIALSAVGSLLVPLDFYAFYLSGGFPADSWPTIWLIGSLLCLVLYITTAYLIQAEFFGYLVAAAVGSSVIAVLKLLNVPDIWWQTGVAATALGLALGSEWLHSQSEQNMWQLLKRPFAHISLAAASAAMVVGTGQAIWGSDITPTYFLALALVWWLSGLTFTLMARRYRLQMVVWSAALAFPIAVWFTGRWLLPMIQVSAAWVAVGWALLVPVYLWVGHLTQRRGGTERDGTRKTRRDAEFWKKRIVAAFSEEAEFGRIVLQTAGVITAVSALWSLGDTSAAGMVHPLLAAAMIVAARLWQQPRLLWLTSLFLLSGAAAWQGGRGATVPELALPWALLSILFVGTAVRLKSTRIRYDEPLFGAGLMAAGLAILPPLLLSDQPLLVYAMGNWIGINGWLAFLSARNESPGLQTLITQRRLQRIGAAIFHWNAALMLLPWLWLFWTNTRAANASMAFAYVVMSWGMMWLCVRVRRLRWQHGLPWQVAAHLSNAAAIILTFFYFQEPWRVGVFVGTAVFYFAAARLFHWRYWVIVGGLLLPIGWWFTLTWLNLPDPYFPPAMALIVLGYMAIAFWIKQFGKQTAITHPLALTALIIGGLLLYSFLGRLLLNFFVPSISSLSDIEKIGIAGGILILGMSLLLSAWMENQVIWAHGGIWLGLLAGGLVVKVYSRGSGRSAALAALAAILLVLTERGLLHLARTQRSKLTPILRYAWRLYRRPLLTAGWLVSLAAIGLATIRNLFWLGGGSPREMWSLVALSLVVGLYAVSAWLFRKPAFITYASLTSFLPWTVATHLFFTPIWDWYGLSWALFALTLLGISILLASRLGRGVWSQPTEIIAHILLPFSLLWSPIFLPVTTISLGLAVLFYGTAVWVNRHFRAKDAPASGLFLYPAAFLVPVWAVSLLYRAVPSVEITTVALLVLAFALPALWLGRRWARWEPAYRWPLYWLAYALAVVAMLLVMEERPFLIGILLFNTGLTILSIWVFRDARWWYPAAVQLPVAIILLLIELRLDEFRYIGWSLVVLGGLYLFGAWALTRWRLRRYAQPLLFMSFLITGIGLLPSVENELGVVVGFGMATTVYTRMAFWKRQPLILFLSVGLSAIAYGAGMLQLNIDLDSLGLAMWPWIGVVLGTAVYLDRLWGVEPNASNLKLTAFPWTQLSAWPDAIWQRLHRWWALSLYLGVFGAIALNGPISMVGGDWQRVLSVGLGTAVFTWALFRFRLRGWLLLAADWAQWLALSLILWVGWANTPAEMALLFLPVTTVTAAFALLIEKVRYEGTPYSWEHGWKLGGWSRPLYLMLFANLLIGQLMSFMGEPSLGVWVTLVHAIIIAVLTTVWKLSGLGYVSLLLGYIGLMQFIDGPPTKTAPALAILALVYGSVGYSVQILTRMKRRPPGWLMVWERPLRISGWLLSVLPLFFVFSEGVGIAGLIVRHWMGFDLITPSEMPQAIMTINTIAILGLFYLFAALADQRPRLGYGALLFLLGSWSLWLLLIAQQNELQFYAIPAAVYLLGIGWLEWQADHRQLARWIDRAALLLLFGSVFWQSFGENGAWYAVLMIVEGLLIGWLGSWRRLRRLLYVGVTAVVIAVAGQLIEPLLALNTFVLLLLGALLVALGIGLERRLESVRALSKEWRGRLEHWE